ncbi:E3 ubiquitin-protein ligase HEL2 [Mercurialis annua]|uniref:E3 ubiquitin-protein ligase HEL2 n=1 Tax=Mercurialis annua TaxID=3986 RepID=UPI002160D741|nr:E3 ubiquitin-protein ligase HEL2 [Mercurialis annua]
MDDSCAVCADTLEWVAYGACGHRDVCSTCVIRLRFICGDNSCCICKTESPVIFITKALGDYTRTISDFAVLPSEPREGRVGSYWYHEDSQAFFDDLDQYRMIKAMCRLSCSVCDKMEDEGTTDGPKRRARFRNIEQLKGHLFHQHKLLMCSLCLEGRKIFICEQKLYTRAQLNQHTRTGDSEVDGSESERGGFAGHPMCEFCKTPFYGDNELYSHMSTEHFTCHICQRQHPGQYEYYKNYDDLEIHFRREHFLCEDEACLAKKFVVFQAEAEMKRHNTMEHAGRMSRAKRSAALQIPTSFQFRRNIEQDHRRGRGRTSQRDQYDNQLSTAIQASMETSHSEGASHGPSSSSSAQLISDYDDANDFDPLVQPFESLTTTDSDAPSRYLQALGHGSRPLQESSFPPLLMNTNNSQQAKHESEVMSNNTMAAHLRRKTRTPTTSSSAQPWTAPRRGNASGSSVQSRPNLVPAPLVSRSPAVVPILSGYASSIQSQAQTRPVVHGHLSNSSPGILGNTNKIAHSASAPNLSDAGSSKPSISEFPPVSASQIRKMPPSNQVLLKVDDVHTANKSLVEKIRAAFDQDEDKYAFFKEVSAQYRQGSIDTENYLHFVQDYGLSHLVLELARLCPDPRKQKELVDAYNASLRSNDVQKNGVGRGSDHSKDNNSTRKGKRIDGEGSSSSSDRLADSIISAVRTLQPNYKSSNEDVEVLSKDGYRGTKGKVHVTAGERQVELRSQNDSTSDGSGSNQNVRDGGGVNKQRKKTSKFQRVRLGDGSMAALLDLKNSGPDPDPDPSSAVDRSGGNNNPGEGLPVRGVWRKGGGHKLFP